MRGQDVNGYGWHVYLGHCDGFLGIARGVLFSVVLSRCEIVAEAKSVCLDVMFWS